MHLYLIKQYNQAAKLKHKSLTSKIDTMIASNRKQRITIAQKSIGTAEKTLLQERWTVYRS